MNKVKVVCIIIMLATLAGTVYARIDDGTLEKLGVGYIFDAYALDDGRVVTVSIDNIDGNYRLTLALDGNNTSDAQCRRFLIPPHYYERLGRPDVVTRLNGSHLHVWLTWGEREHYLYYSWKIPLYREYLPAAILTER